MEEEIILTGYCRTLDGSRTVMVEDGEADCLFPDCPYGSECTIAKTIRKKQDEELE